MSVCELSDLPVEMCACRVHAPKTDRSPAEFTVSGQVFLARFGGRCVGCDGQIVAGDRIVAVVDDADHAAGYVHAEDECL